LKQALEAEAACEFDDAEGAELTDYESVFGGSSPLSTPPSSRPSSPDPLIFAQPSTPPILPQVTPSRSRTTSRKNASAKLHRKIGRKNRDARKRARAIATNTSGSDALHYKIKVAVANANPLPPQIETMFNGCDLPAAKGAWTGLRDAAGEEAKNLNDLLKEGLEIYKWDGSSPVALTDSEGRVVVVLVGRPIGDGSWNETVEQLDIALEQARADLAFGISECLPRPSRDCKVNRRGDFKTAAAGISYGGGQKQPGNLSHSDRNAKVLNELISNRHVQRVLGFGSSTFAFYAPKLYSYYSDTFKTLLRSRPGLRRNSRHSIFPAVSFNFGPSVVTLEHIDFNNLPHGWCWVQSGGKYDPTTGGHLILRDLGLVVEFPPGSSILLPSGSLRHGNVPILQGETRTSITQYAAGGLFRWVHYGCRSEKGLKAQDPRRAKEVAAERTSRWKEALALFSFIDQLQKDREDVFGRSFSRSI